MRPSFYIKMFVWCIKIEHHHMPVFYNIISELSCYKLLDLLEIWHMLPLVTAKKPEKTLVIKIVLCDD